MDSDISETTHTRRPVSFRLRHLFTLILACAVWLAIFRVSQNSAIVVGVSIVPGMISLVVASMIQNRRVARLSVFGKSLWLLTASCVWFGIYILSIGPVVALVEAVGIGDSAAKRFYDPVVWLHDNTILELPLEWYSYLWGWN